MKSRPAREELDEIKRSLSHSLGAEGGLAEFYELVRKDDILRHVIEDLYRMHSTGPDTIFPEAALAILQMMSCFISKYCETAEFDGRSISAFRNPFSQQRGVTYSMAGAKEKTVVQDPKEAALNEFEEGARRSIRQANTGLAKTFKPKKSS